MNIADKNIDNGNPFDWGRTSEDYAKFRDIYPQAFYQKILERNLCTDGQSVLDLGTGTGVLPRNMYRYGAKWTATDISENQIAQARILSEGMDIMLHPRRILTFPTISLTSLQPVSVFGILTMKRLCLNFGVC